MTTRATASATKRWGPPERSVVFVNSLLYIWSIATLIYGDAEALPITAIVALDEAFVAQAAVGAATAPFSRA